MMAQKTLSYKTILIIVSILVLTIIGQSLYFNYKSNQHKAYFEKQVQTVKDSISAINTRQDKIITNAKTATKKAASNKQSINDKLKQDETAINNRTVTDDELDDFLAGFED